MHSGRPAAGVTPSDLTSQLDDAEEYGSFPKCGTHNVIGKKDLEWTHGEVQFEETNLRAKYIIVPEGISDANDVVAVMCSLWRLKIPELFLVLPGGQDTAAGMLENVLDQDVWLHATDDAGVKMTTAFSDALVKTSKGIATACSKTNAWVYGFDGSYGSADGDPLWGTCFNTAWSYFGQGRRTTSSCKRVEFVCAKSLRGVFGERKFRKYAVSLCQTPETVVHYPSVSHRLQKQGRTVPDCVSTEDGKMSRPERSQMIWPEFTHIILYDGDSCKYPFPDLYKTMRSLTPTVHVVIGGVHPTLTNSVVEESDNVPMVILKNTGGAADVLAKAVELKQKSLAPTVKAQYHQSADVFFDQVEEWKALKWSSMYPTTTQWTMPAGVRDSSFIIVDAKKDTAVNIVDKILRVHSYTDDAEARGLGNATQEHDRLQDAWKQAICYSYNGAHFGVTNSLCTYSIMVITLLTLVIGILNIQISRHHERQQYLPKLAKTVLPVGEWAEWVLSDLNCQIVVIVLPLLSGFLLSCASRFSPFYKWTQLMNAANMIKTEIYRFRARVGEYSRRQGPVFNVHDRLRRMPAVRHELLLRGRWRGASSGVDSRATSGYNTPKGGGGGSIPDDRSVCDSSTVDYSQADFGMDMEPLLDEYEAPAKKRKTKRLTRRGAFQHRMEQIQTELGNSDVRVGTLAEPSRRAVRNARSELYGASDRNSLFNSRFDEAFQVNKQQDRIQGNTADDGFCTLVTDDYIRFRVRPAIEELSRISRGHERAIFSLELLRYVATMVCAMMGVLEMYLMIPIVVSFIGVLTNILDFHQFTMRLQSVNSALTDLRNLVIWWESLDMEDQRAAATLDHVLEVTESALTADFLMGARPTHRKPTKEDRSNSNDHRKLNVDNADE